MTAFRLALALLYAATSGAAVYVEHTQVKTLQQRQRSLGRLLPAASTRIQQRSTRRSVAMAPAAADSKVDPDGTSRTDKVAGMSIDWPQAFGAVMCFSLFAIHVIIYRRDTPGALTVGLYMAYVVLHTTTSTAVALMGHNASSATVSSAEASARAVVVLALLAKLAISLALFLWEEVPEAGERGIWPARFHVVWVARTTLLSTALPACLYTAADVLIVACQQKLSMTEIQVISKLGVPLTTIIWSTCFRTPVGVWKWVGLLGILAGGGIYYGGSGTVSNASSWFMVNASHFKLALYYSVLMLLQTVLSSLGGVSCEYLLRKKEGSINLQNTSMYAWGLVLLALQNRSVDFFDNIEFTSGMIVSVACFAATGICTAFFLKHLGSVWKQVGYATLVVVYFFVDGLCKFTQHDMVQTFGVFVTFLGASCFLLDGWTPLPQERRDATRTCNSL